MLVIISMFLNYVIYNSLVVMSFNLSRPGVGKTTVLREIARVLSDEFHKRVVS